MISERIYRLLLCCYPNEFRAEYGAEMAMLYRDRRRHEPLTRLWIDVLPDTLVTAFKEHMHMLWKDLFYAVRAMRQAPALTAAAVLRLALAIGANTAMFSVTNGVVLRALPFPEPQRLVRIWAASDKLREPFFGVSIPNLVSWREQAHSFDDVAGWRGGGLNVVFDSDAERVPGLWISPSFFPVMGLQPIVGRPFRPGEDRPGSAPVAMIGYQLWTRRFHRDLQAIGRTLQWRVEATRL
jgi:hypothetical protein